MYKLVIVDDEKQIREGLKRFVDWEAMGFTVTETFADGKEVIEYLDYMVPDVILTDIKMNNVSGLEVAGFVHENQLDCVVAFISGYSEFEYAVRGMEYGVKEYLFKPTELAEVKKSFGKIKHILDEKAERYAREDKEKKRTQQAIRQLNERFFSDIIMGAVNSEEYIRSSMSILYPELDVEKAPCFLADIYIEDYAHFMKEVWQYGYDQLEVNLRNYFQIYRYICCFNIVYKTENVIEVLGILVEKREGDEQTVMAAAMKRLLEELEQSFLFKASYEIQQTYASVYEIEPIHRRTNVSVNTGFVQKHLKEQEKLVISNVLVGNVIMAQRVFHEMVEGAAGQSFSQKKQLVWDVMRDIQSVLVSMDEKMSEQLQHFFDISEEMTDMETCMEWADSIFEKIKNAGIAEEEQRRDSLIEKVKAYIQEKICEDISQEDVAKQVYISTSYLSRLFKKQTGQNFQQYVSYVKMEKAKELLVDPQYKVYQVGEMLGYKTLRYFVRAFRAHTGMNPGEYRRNVLRLGAKYEENE